MLEKYAEKQNLQCKYKKNSTRATFLLPLKEENQLVEFEVIFEKGRKKKDQGLYKLRFQFGEQGLSKLSQTDVEFIITGFIGLIENCCVQANNPLYSLEDEATQF